jgi:hypothetical protein
VDWSSLYLINKTKLLNRSHKYIINNNKYLRSQVYKYLSFAYSKYPNKLRSVNYNKLFRKLDDSRKAESFTFLQYIIPRLRTRIDWLCNGFVIYIRKTDTESRLFNLNKKQTGLSDELSDHFDDN